jgi:molecular chaperone HtpG
MAANQESFQFQAETKRLLDIMIHSLYTNKEIFLRELISNASDALDRVRFEALTKTDLLVEGEKFEIRLDTDPESRTLTISDNGIGMSWEDVIANIGTIAKSGTRELREKIEADQTEEMLAEMIGQFGVGFYSCFMVADKVTLVTRKAGENKATRWESIGDGSYTLAEAERPEHGTSITLHLKAADQEQGIEDYTDKWVLSRIIKRHSDFVSYPIVYKDVREETEEDGQPDSGKDEAAKIVVEDKILNSMKPIWTRSQSEVTESDYAEFYKHISHDWNEPLKTISVRAEGRQEYQALVFIPSKASYDLYYQGFESGLRLYSKRVLIMERCEDLLPNYLRFIKGIVDSSDLPLNISRQMLQQDRHITQIRKWLIKKIISTLEQMYEKENDKYLEFWKHFGRALKEGVSSDYENKDKLVSLLLFESSNDAEKLTGLKDYLARMKEEQNEIFYVTGESRGIVENLPHLEAFKKDGYEVLYLIDPVDELVVQALTQYEGKKLKSIGKGRVKLDSEGEESLKQKEEASAGLLEFLQKKLDEHVKQVRLTNRLTVSPVCLVVEDHDYSPQLERLLQKGKGGGPKQRRVLELNPDHQMFIKMQMRYQKDQSDPVLENYAELLYGYALLAEGSELPDPVKFNRLIADLMVEAL